MPHESAYLGEIEPRGSGAGSAAERAEAGVVSIAVARDAIPEEER
jgi:hypothetical protein